MAVTEQRYETFTVLINRISRNIRKLKNQEMAEYNLKNVHVSCLYYLYSVGRMTSAELSEYCEEDKAAISRAVDFLESNGYLMRQNPNKKYRSHLVLTEKGVSIGKTLSDKITDTLDSFDSILSEEERVIFYNHLAQISEHLASAVEADKKG